MGYTKYVQYGQILEVYEYQNNITTRHAPSKLTALRFQKNIPNNEKVGNYKRPKGKRELERLQLKKKNYQRSAYSIRRAKQSFFRLCHHNNTFATSIHFFTLTFSDDVTFKKANRCLSEFIAVLRKNYEVENSAISYIGVSEFTKKERIHFHLLIYNLSSDLSVRERETRNIQRLWGRGFVDIRFASYTSEGLAGYLVKYMGKALSDGKNGGGRGYYCSRNIKKIYSKGSNSLDKYSDIITPDILAQKVDSYNVPFLGVCIKSKYVYNDGIIR